MIEAHIHAIYLLVEERTCVLLLVFPVALSHLVASNAKLAFLACRQFVAILVKNKTDAVGQRLAYRDDTIECLVLASLGELVVSAIDATATSATTY